MIADLPSSPAVEGALLQCIKDLQELASVWAWCSSALRGIAKLVDKLNIQLPQEAWNALSAPPSPPSPMHEHDINMLHHPGYGLSGGSGLEQYKVKLENIPNDFVETADAVNTTTNTTTCGGGDPGWGQLGGSGEDFQFVDTIVGFQSQFDEWGGCIASEM